MLDLFEIVILVKWVFVVVNIVLFSMLLAVYFFGNFEDEDAKIEKRDQKLKVLFVTAHPDDETMFFTPSLLAWKDHHV
jgi:heme/copper-type cytochrome/quinol oxidase subunit 3